MFLVSHDRCLTVCGIEPATTIESARILQDTARNRSGEHAAVGIPEHRIRRIAPAFCFACYRQQEWHADHAHAEGLTSDLVASDELAVLPDRTDRLALPARDGLALREASRTTLDDAIGV
jgi:hypothetical protein